MISLWVRELAHSRVDLTSLLVLWGKEAQRRPQGEAKA